MENVEILAYGFCALVFAPSVFFIFYQRKTRLKIKEILWECYLPMENHSMEEISIIECFDYDLVTKIKEDFFKKKNELHCLTTKCNIKPFSDLAVIKDVEEADKLVSELNIGSRKIFIICSTASTVAHLLMAVCFLLHSNT